MTEKRIEAGLKYEFECLAKGECTELILSGVIGESFFADTITAKKVKTALEKIDGDITIKLNSGGGDVFEGLEIYNYLKSLDNHITIEVTGLAASAASLVLMGADERVICTGANVMIHNASTITYGNKDDIQKTLNALETIDDSLIDIYLEHSNLSAEAIKNFMEEETWFTADQAIACGLADRRQVAKKEAVEQEEKVVVVKSPQQFVAEAKPKVTALERFKKIY